MKSVVHTFIIALLPFMAMSADSELVNIKSGISLTWSGTKGADYMEEYFYFDKQIYDGKVVYIKAATDIAMAHNANNIAGTAGGSDDYEVVGAGVGVIKYKVDGDQRWGLYPANWTTYSSPIAFEDLKYGLFGAVGISVVGSTGDNGIPLTVGTKMSRFHRGIRDSVGDEWHTLTVADDDSAYSGSEEYKSSDGKVFLFVVNPKTPCLTWRVTGTGQFYTTPAKKYFVPHIFDQTTYLSTGSAGTVSVEITDINGNNVFYRINGGNWQSNGTKSVTLNQNAFANGTNTLEYYYSGREANAKTRTVVKSPNYPSAGEAHGDRLWVNATWWTNEVSRKLPTWWLDQWRNTDSHNDHSAIVQRRRTGKRVLASRSPIVNALVARKDGFGAKKSNQPLSYAEFAKAALLECATILDPVGAELNSSNNPIPSREIIYRGYYDVRQVYSAAAAYDILIGHYRSDQGWANGITPIEDYFIRDSLARWVHLAGMSTGGWNDPAYYGLDTGGMWDTARKTGAAFVACMMPAYSTRYYGTSGLDGNSTVFNDYVFPVVNYTWKALYLDNSVAPLGFPDVTSRVGVSDYLFTSQGKWTDRISYADTALMGQCNGIYYNLLKLFNPTATLPNFDLAMSLAAQGQLSGTKIVKSGDANPRFFSWTVMCNAWHPQFRAVAQPRAVALSTSNGQHPGKQFSAGGPFYVLWYDMNLPVGSAPQGAVSTPAFSPNGGTFSTPQSVTITTSTPGASIRFTTNGVTPTATSGTLYSGPVLIGNGLTTLKAIALKAGLPSSTERVAVFQVGSIAATPVINPAGDVYLMPQQVTISSATPLATIYYTTDGSTPTASSPRYTGPFLMAASGVVRAIAVLAGSQDSQVATETYQISSIVSSDSLWTSVPIPAQDGEFGVSFDVTPGVNAVIGLSPADASTWADLAALVRFAPNRFVDARNGGAYEALAAFPYNTETTYRVVINLNVTTRTYSATIAAPGLPPVLVASNYAFRTEQSSATEVNFFAVWTEIGSSTLENFLIWDSAANKPLRPSGVRTVAVE